MRCASRAVLLLAGILLLGMAPPSPASTLLEERLGSNDGLPSDLVKSVARDRFGFIWLATDAGLVRYDGTEFSTYEDELSFPFGKGLLLTRGGRLLALGDAGLVEIAGTPARVRFRVLFEAAFVPEPGVLSAPKGLYEDGRGRLWVSEPQGIVRVDGDRLVRYELPPSSHSASFLRSYCVAEDGFGTLWAAAQTGKLFRFDDGADRFVPVDIRWPVTVVNELRAVADDRLWAATTRGVFEIRVEAGGQVLDVAQIDDTDQVSSIGRVGNDVVLGTFGLEAQLGRLEGGQLSPRGRIPVFIVQRILEDEDGSLWLSTDEGVLHLRPAVFQVVRLADEVLNRYLVSFVQTEDGAIYASDRRDVYRLRRGPRGMVAEPLLDEPSPFLLGLRTDGRFVYAAHEAGLLQFDGDRLVRRLRLEGSYAQDLEQGGDSRLWLIRATDDGVLRVAPDGSERYYGVGEGVPRRALALDRSPTGELIVATNDPTALLLRYDAGSESFARIAVDLLFEPGDDFNVYDVAIHGQDRYWIATSAGLLEIRGRRARRVGTGPSGASPPALAVAIDDDGSVWFATGGGVIRLDPETGEHDLFDEGAGLPSRIVGVRDLFAVPGGGVTAATARGLARLEGSPGTRGELPAPALLDVRINDQPIEPGAEAPTVPYAGYVASRFASPHYGSALAYQVRLEGRDESWRPPQSRNEILLAGMDSGPYTLQVRAVLPGSDRVSAPTSFSFTVSRPWYQTWWALLLAVAALGAVAWAASAVRSWRSARTEQRLRDLVDERTQELSEANRLLGERNVEMERFTYTVSHDLKSPLISISGFIGLLEADLEKGQLAEAGDYVARVKSSASRMSTLLDELLELSRIGRVRDEPELVALRPLVDEVTREMATRFAESGVEVSVQPDLPTVFVDRGRLRQVLQNLLDNSLKFFGDQGRPRVEIGGLTEDGRARLFVRDNGVGIAPAHHEEAFELFRRLHANVDGTGVGLSVAKRIVEVHGGRIWLESEGRPGRGTTVWLELPAGRSD